MKYQIDGNKIANGNAKEALKFIYLVNPAAFRVLLRTQGHDIRDVNELYDLIDDVRAKRKRVDFVRIIKLVPIDDKILKGAAGHIEIIGRRTEKPRHINTRHNIGLFTQQKAA